MDIFIKNLIQVLFYSYPRPILSYTGPIFFVHFSDFSQLFLIFRDFSQFFHFLLMLSAGYFRNATIPYMLREMKNIA